MDWPAAIVGAWCCSLSLGFTLIFGTTYQGTMLFALSFAGFAGAIVCE